jgi:hypothetical protein
MGDVDIVERLRAAASLIEGHPGENEQVICRLLLEAGAEITRQDGVINSLWHTLTGHNVELVIPGEVLCDVAA